MDRSPSQPPTPSSSTDSASNLPPLNAKQIQTRSNLRRNSISLPALTKIDLEQLKRLNQISQEVSD